MFAYLTLLLIWTQEHNSVVANEFLPTEGATENFLS